MGGGTVGKRTRTVTHEDFYTAGFCSNRAVLDHLDRRGGEDDLLVLARLATALVGHERASQARRIFGIEGVEEDLLTPAKDDEDGTAAFDDWTPETITPHDDDFDNPDGSGRSWRKL